MLVVDEVKEGCDFLSHLSELREILSQVKLVACDLETTGLVPTNSKAGLDPYFGDIVCVGLLFGENLDGLRITGGSFGSILLCKEAFLMLIEGLELPKDQEWVFHNAKFDLKFLKYRCNFTPPKIFCTMLANQLIQNGNTEWTVRFPTGKNKKEEVNLLNLFEQPVEVEEDKKSGVEKISHSLEACIYHYISQPVPLDKSIRATLPSKLSQYSSNEIHYVIDDIRFLFELRSEMIEQQKKIWSYQYSKESPNKHCNLFELEFRCCMILAEIELTGFPLDVSSWSKLIQHKESEVTRIEADIKKFYPNLNPSSSQQRKVILKNEGANLVNHKGEESTDKDTLQREFKRGCKSRLLKLLIEFGEANSFIGLGKSVLKAAEQYPDKRLRPNFGQILASGRISTYEPNIINIPHTKEFRDCFRAPEGKKMITIDFSNCELAILFNLFNCTEWSQKLKDGKDIHGEMASQFFGIEVSKTKNSELRGKMKTTTFGILYGIGAAALSAKLDITQEEAKELLLTYGKKFPDIISGLRKVFNDVSVSRIQYNKTQFRRMLRYPENANLNSSKNYMLQSANADLIKMSIIKCTEYLKTLGDDYKIVNSIHDELVFEVPDNDQIEVVCENLQRIMSEQSKFIGKGLWVNTEAKIDNCWAK